MKRLILIVLCFISSGVSGQSREEKWRLLDPRNYANGMTFVDDCELQVRGADISEYDLLDTGEIVVVYRFRHPFLQKTRPSVADGELMVLEIGSRMSAFYSQDLYITDSLYTILVQRKNPRGMSSHSVRHIVYRDRVKHRFEVVERIPFHSGEAIIIEDSGEPLWRIDTLRREIHGYRCLRAETDYRGRKWMVWFTPDIPLSCGPWKLVGLPGLILEAEDAEGQYSYRCEGLKKRAVAIKKYHWRYKQMDRKAWLKFEKRIHTAPFSVFGNSTLVVSGKRKGRLDETWEIPYIPLERE